MFILVLSDGTHVAIKWKRARGLGKWKAHHECVQWWTRLQVDGVVLVMILRRSCLSAFQERDFGPQVETTHEGEDMVIE